jgi:hypothetical protein
MTTWPEHASEVRGHRSWAAPEVEDEFASVHVVAVADELRGLFSCTLEVGHSACMAP